MREIRIYTEKVAAIRCIKAYDYGNYTSFGLCVGLAMVGTAVGEAAVSFGRCFSNLGRKAYAELKLDELVNSP